MKYSSRVQEHFDNYLNVKLKVSFVHLLGNHTFYDVYRHKLETIICWAKNVVSFTLLNFQIQKSARILSVSIFEQKVKIKKPADYFKLGSQIFTLINF